VFNFKLKNRFIGQVVLAMNRFWLSQGAHTALDSGANLEILLIAGTF
jgi:hypothetical protein